jgi:hypothetical protein
MNEYILNLHMHTPLSDGEGTYDEILKFAIDAGIDAVIVTDHNVWVDGAERILETNGKRSILLIGEEVHDQARDPQKNHMLVFNSGQELATFTRNPQELIDQVRFSGGLCFLAHPLETDLAAFGEPDISWVDWQVSGYTGFELWNGFSEFKAVVHNRFQALFYAFFPKMIAHGPPARLLKKWDQLLVSGKQVVTIGGSDAHALKIQLGPFHRIVFPYSFHFQSVNTHLIISEHFNGSLEHDRKLIYASLEKGNCFIGYDLPHSTRGFSFSAESGGKSVIMGETISIDNEVKFNISVPGNAAVRLIREGEIIRKWKNETIFNHTDNLPGVYRVECSIKYLGKTRGWIYSNPIYVREE